MNARICSNWSTESLFCAIQGWGAHARLEHRLPSIHPEVLMRALCFALGLVACVVSIGCGSDGSLAPSGGAGSTGGATGASGGSGGASGASGSGGAAGASGSGGASGASGSAAGASGSDGAAGASGSDGAAGVSGGGGSVPIEAGQGSDAPPDGAVAAACSGPKPSAANTGVKPGRTLTRRGSITVTNDNTIVEDLDILGTIVVSANNVTIRNVRITTGNDCPIRYFDNGKTGLLVEDSELVGGKTAAIAFRDYTARRLNIHGGTDGLKADANVLIEDCWIHDLSNRSGEHNDGVESTGGTGVTIRHNNISGASNACVQTGDENAATEDLTVECNWLDGGGYALNIRGTGATVPKNTRIINNRFGRNSGYGPWTIDDPAPTVTGNVYDDTGEPIPYP
jgi:hypothetical protein